MIAGGLFIAPFFLFSGRLGHAGRPLGQGRDRPLGESRRDRIMALGAWGLALRACRCCWRRSSASARTPPCSARSNTRCCRSTCATTSWWPATRSSKAGTFLSILLGTILGGSIVLVDQGALVVGAVGIASAGSAWPRPGCIPAAPPAAGGDLPRPRLFHDTCRVLPPHHRPRRAASAHPGALVVLAVRRHVVSGLPVLAKDVLFANEHVVTLMLALFAVGVGMGSVLAERLLHGEVSARFVPGAALAMAFFAFDLYRASAGRSAGAELAGVMTFVQTPGSVRVLVDLVGMAIAGGLFTVPLYAVLQHESEADHRARVIASNNIINALAMSTGAS
jgi:acyl-[acyl-carrier-protein]-phospholipid O-acyltransferase/long-chain-fatty-acid--[acyl-carrier-protein] ligase